MSRSAASAALDIIEHDDLAAARRVVGQQSRALARLAEMLSGRFVDATSLLAATRGRIVVSGMGKSGHIGNKIAATLASTGSPALFVHPAEASHGDLGMITDADVLLTLSNSGETPELADLVNYAKRFRIPLIAIVGRAPSTLADAATVALVLPDEPEAGTLGLAPTTSTIMMLALGDALAVALLERKGLTAEDFKLYHPGGKLGRRLVRVTDIMHAGDALPLVPAEYDDGGGPDRDDGEAARLCRRDRRGRRADRDRDRRRPQAPHGRGPPAKAGFRDHDARGR